MVRAVVKKAMNFAKEKHKDQIDDSGNPYFFAHVMQVYKLCHDVTDDDEVLQVALLHDTLEDTDTTFNELVENFGFRIADMINMVTHDGDKNKGGYYFPRLVTDKKIYNELTHKAVIVKFSDRLSNLSRMDAWHRERKAHYLYKSRFWKLFPKESQEEITDRFEVNYS